MCSGDDNINTYKLNTCKCVCGWGGPKKVVHVCEHGTKELMHVYE